MRETNDTDGEYVKHRTKIRTREEVEDSHICEIEQPSPAVIRRRGSHPIAVVWVFAPGRQLVFVVRTSPRMDPFLALHVFAGRKERSHGPLQHDRATTHGVVRVAVVATFTVEAHIASCNKTTRVLLLEIDSPFLV